MTLLLLGIGGSAVVGGGGGSDPNFASVKLLMGFNGANGSTGSPGMTDESSAAHGTASVTGGTAISTAQAMFGSSSLGCNGSGGALYADSPDWRLSAANSDQFTIDMSVRFTSIATNIVILSQYSSDGTYSWTIQIGASNTLVFGFSPNGTFASGVSVTGPTLATNTWYQIAVDKDATGKIRLYVGGTMVASATPANSSFFDSAQRLGIGVTDAGGGPLNGFVDELRITKGLARYASDSGYTVATSAFPRS